MKRRCHPNSLALILGALLAVGGCATADDYRTTQRQVEGQGAELKTQIRQLEEKVMSTMNGRMERDRRDLEGRLESQSAQVSAWIETEDKKLNGRFDEKVGRTQEALNTFGKRMDERFDAQDRAVKKIEADGRATSARNADIDKALAQVTETVRSVGAKLSQQVEQQSASLGRLDENSKQTDAQLKALSGRVTQFQATLAEFSKVAHALNEKAGETGRQSEDKLSALAKRVELDGQAMTTHLNAVTQNVTALTKTVDNTVATVNETTRVVGDLKRAVEVSVGKLASRVDEQGEVLNHRRSWRRRNPTARVRQKRSTSRRTLNTRRAGTMTRCRRFKISWCSIPTRRWRPMPISGSRRATFGSVTIRAASNRMNTSSKIIPRA